MTYKTVRKSLKHPVSEQILDPICNLCKVVIDNT